MAQRTLKYNRGRLCEFAFVLPSSWLILAWFKTAKTWDVYQIHSSWELHMAETYNWKNVSKSQIQLASQKALCCEDPKEIYLRHSKEQVNFSWHQFAASAGEILAVIWCVSHGAPYWRCNICTLTLPTLTELPLGTTLHVSPKQGKERHKTSDKLFCDYSGVVEPTWETKFIHRLDWKLCNVHQVL